MITRIELARKRPGSTYDPKAKVYVTYKVSVRVNGRRYRQSGFPSRKAAEAFVDSLKLKKAYTRVGMPAPQSGEVRLAALLEKRLASLTGPEAVRARRIFARFREMHGNPLVTEIRRAHLQAYINERLPSVKPETVVRELAMLTAALRSAAVAFPDELEDYQPPTVARPKVRRGKVNRRTVSEQEMRAVADYLMAGDAFSRMIARQWELAWYLGLRYGETAKLLKTDYDGHRLRVTRWKTKDETVFEHLPPRVKEILAAAVSESPTERVFPHGRWIHLNKFYDVLRAAIEATGMPYGRKPDSVSFHSLRHSFITRMVSVSDLPTTQSFSGHSDAAMVAYYSHATEESRRKAMDKLYGPKVKWADVYIRIRNGDMDLEEFLELVDR